MCPPAVRLLYNFLASCYIFKLISIATCYIIKMYQEGKGNGRLQTRDRGDGNHGWTSGAGKSLKVTVTLSRILTDYFGNGDWSPQAGLSGEWTIDTESWIDGKSQGGEWLRDIKQGDVVGCIGKIGLKEDRKTEYEAMVARLKEHPHNM